MVRLISPVIPVTDEPQLCFSFWYAAFGAGESALLQIMRQDNSSGETPAEKVKHNFPVRSIAHNYNDELLDYFVYFLFVDLEFRSEKYGYYKAFVDAGPSYSRIE